MSQNVTDSNGKISVKERIAYGFGDFSSNIMYSAMSAFLMFYYTDVVGVGAAAVGVIMMCSRLFDGVSDLIMGIIIDRTNSKYGKARVWILRLVIPYAIGTVLLFAVPTGWTQTAKLIYIFFSYNLAFTVLFTGINLPYATLTALMTQNQYERSVLSIFRMILATSGTLFIKTCTLPVVEFFGNDAHAWTYTFIVFGILEIITFMITFLGTKERVGNDLESKKENLPVKDGFKALVKNKYWFMATLNLILIFIAQGVNGSAEVYYTKNVLGNSNLIGTFSVALQVTQIICMLFIAIFVKKYGKRNVLMAGAAIMIIGYGIMAVAGTSVPVLIIGCAARGIGNAGISACMFAMVTDIRRVEDGCAYRRSDQQCCKFRTEIRKRTQHSPSGCDPEYRRICRICKSTDKWRTGSNQSRLYLCADHINRDPDRSTVFLPSGQRV